MALVRLLSLARALVRAVLGAAAARRGRCARSSEHARERVVGCRLDLERLELAAEGADAQGGQHGGTHDRHAHGISREVRELDFRLPTEEQLVGWDALQQQLLVPKHRAAEAREVILAAGRDAARGARPVERGHQVNVLRNVPDDHLVQRVHMRLGHFDGTRVDQVDGAPAEAPNVLRPLVRRAQRQHAIGPPMGEGARKLGDPCPLLEAEIDLEIERRLVGLHTPLLALDLLEGSV